MAACLSSASFHPAELSTVLWRLRRSPQMVYLPPALPPAAPNPLPVVPAYQTHPVQPRQAQTLAYPYLSFNGAYPAYLYSGRANTMSRQAAGTYPGYYYPTPNYYAYNINVNLPFSGISS